jgi:ABC-type lipoprotein export system ATPase subunit
VGVTVEVPAARNGAPGAANLAPLIRLEDVIKVYRDGDVETIALRGIDLAVSAGDFVAIMGRSGSGKSTLLNLLAGSDRPTAGRVVIDGTDVGRSDETTRADLRGRTVGIVYQLDNLVPFLTLAENVALAGRLGGATLASGDVGRLLQRMGIEDRANHRPGQLSGGEQQRGALACVLAAKPRVLLADEITGELDSENARLVLDLLAGMNEIDSMTVVLVTHDSGVASSAKRLVELQDGRVVRDERTS